MEKEKWKYNNNIQLTKMRVRDRERERANTNEWGANEGAKYRTNELHERRHCTIIKNQHL